MQKKAIRQKPKPAMPAKKKAKSVAVKPGRKAEPKSKMSKMLEDMVIYADQSTKKAKRKKTTPSGIYKGVSDEDAIAADAMGVNPFLNGIPALKQVYQRLPVANLNGINALPMMGDPWQSYDAPRADQTGIKGSKRKGMKIRADMGGESMGGGADVAMMPPIFHTPGNAQDAYYEPKSYVEQIRWARLMFNGNPYIYSITRLKAYYPLGKFRLNTSEPWVTQWYESVAFRKEFNLSSFVMRMNLQKNKFGECVVMGEKRHDGYWPQTGQPRWIWGSMAMIEPEILDIKKPRFGNAKTRYFMRPNRDLEEFARALEDGDDEDVKEIRDKFPKPILDKIRNRESVELDGELISVIADLTDASAVRGTPPYMPLYKAFILEDFVRLALMAQSYRYHFPIELWLLGNVEKNFMPTPRDVQNLRRVVQQALTNPPFAIFYPDLLKYQAVGVQGALLDIEKSTQFIQRQYLVGTGVSEEMILGSALKLDTLIPTPTGWTTMGELKVGDEVFARDGSITSVWAVSPVWKDRPTYSVKIGGAEPIIADENHQWVVRCNTSDKLDRQVYVERIYTTGEILKRLNRAVTNQSGMRIPMAQALDMPDVTLPIPPYTLGAWLGDGTSTNATFTCHDADTETVENIRKDGFTVVKRKNYCSWGILGLERRLMDAGLWGKKHIPDIYMRASKAQRLALFQGMLDTDGSAKTGRSHSCSFANTNYAMVVAAKELALTLGFRPGTISISQGKQVNKAGNPVKPCFSFCFTMGKNSLQPFRLARKQSRANVKPDTKYQVHPQDFRTVESIDRVPSVPTVCIQVAHPTGTFLAGRDFVVTHNSSMFGSNDTVGNQAFIRGMQKDRDELENWMQWNFFEPMAQWNNLKSNNNGVLTPIVPEIIWNKTLDHKAEEDEKENVKWLWDQGLADPEAVIAKLGKSNPQEVAIKIGKAVDGPFDKDERFGSKAFRAKVGATNMGGEGAQGGDAAGGEQPRATVEAPEAPGGAGEKPAEGTPAEEPSSGETPEAPPGEEVKI